MNTIRKYWMPLAAAVAVVSLLAGWYFTLRPGLYIRDDFYYRVSDSKVARNKSEYIERTGENTYSLVSNLGTKTVEVTKHGDDYDFFFSDGETLNLKWDGWFYDDGSGSYLEVEAYTNYSIPPISNRTYAYAIIDMDKGDYVTISHWGLMVLGLVFYILGIVYIRFPEEMHFLFSRWVYRNAELSDAGKRMEQISGAAISILGILSMTGIILAFMD